MLEAKQQAGGSRPEPQQGETFADRYHLRREIARGGMGTVWEAEDDKLRRAVAIKLLTGALADADDARRRFDREATAVASLQCGNIVQVFDYGVERDVPFFVMEFLQGEDLQKRMKREGYFTIDDTARIVWQVAKALGVAHAAGIVHRDLKPGNVFLVKQADDEVVKVLDFGVAKTRAFVAEESMPSRAMAYDPGDGDEPTKAGIILGTPQYMSPEQARGMRTIDHRADLWALSVIAYRMIVGKLPFRGKTTTEVLVSQLAARWERPSRARPHLPAEVDEFFERAFASDLDARFASAREVARALRFVTAVSLPTLSVPDPRRPMTSDPSLVSGQFAPPSSKPIIESLAPPTRILPVEGPEELEAPRPAALRRRVLVFLVAGAALAAAGWMLFGSDTKNETTLATEPTAGEARTEPSATAATPSAAASATPPKPSTPQQARDRTRPRASAPRARPTPKPAPPKPSVDPFAERL